MKDSSPTQMAKHDLTMFHVIARLTKQPVQQPPAKCRYHHNENEPTAALKVHHPRSENQEKSSDKNYSTLPKVVEESI
jgi:hypothetical protein